MEYAKDEIFQIRYNNNLNRLEIGNKKWTSRFIKTVKRHKLISIIIIAFIIFSIANVIMIFNFMEILQSM